MIVNTMLSTTQYLDLIGITQWQLRPELTPEVLIPRYVQPQAQWLFVLEKQEVMLDSPLLTAILTAINQTLESVTIAYYDEAASAPMPELSKLRVIVAMGEGPAQQLQNQSLYSPDIPVIISDNLATLANNTHSKRTLWQQLKAYQS